MKNQLEKLIAEQALDMSGRYKYRQPRKKMSKKDLEMWQKRKSEKGKL